MSLEESKNLALKMTRQYGSMTTQKLSNIFFNKVQISCSEFSTVPEESLRRRHTNAPYVYSQTSASSSVSSQEACVSVRD